MSGAEEEKTLETVANLESGQIEAVCPNVTVTIKYKLVYSHPDLTSMDPEKIIPTRNRSNVYFNPFWDMMAPSIHSPGLLKEVAKLVSPNQKECIESYYFSARSTPFPVQLNLMRGNLAALKKSAFSAKGTLINIVERYNRSIMKARSYGRIFNTFMIFLKRIVSLNDQQTLRTPEATPFTIT